MIRSFVRALAVLAAVASCNDETLSIGRNDGPPGMTGTGGGPALTVGAGGGPATGGAGGGS